MYSKSDLKDDLNKGRPLTASFERLLSPTVGILVEMLFNKNLNTITLDNTMISVDSVLGLRTEKADFS